MDGKKFGKLVMGIQYWCLNLGKEVCDFEGGLKVVGLVVG